MSTESEQDKLPGPLLNLQEYEAAAKVVLPPPVFDFVAGGSGDETTWMVSAPTLQARACSGSTM